MEQDHATEILKDELAELCNLQAVKKYKIDELLFKDRRKSLEKAIKILENN